MLPEPAGIYEVLTTLCQRGVPSVGLENVLGTTRWPSLSTAAAFTHPRGHHQQRLSAYKLTSSCEPAGTTSEHLPLETSAEVARRTGRYRVRI